MSDLIETNKAVCELCGEPMPSGEEMFKFHGYSGDCPKEPLPRKPVDTVESLRAERMAAEIARLMLVCGDWQRQSGQRGEQVEQLTAEVERYRTALLAAKRSHYECDDCWYSCPKSGECCNEAEGSQCNCGADRHNAAIDEAIKEAGNG